MNTRKQTSQLFFALLSLGWSALAATALSAQEPSSAEEIKLDYRKLERATARSGRGGEDLAKPSAALPSELRIDESKARQEVEAPPEAPAPSETEGMEKATGQSRIDLEGRPGGRHRPPPSGISNKTVAEEASRAAFWTARKLVDERGRVQYYRVGLWQGLREALERSQWRRFDYEDGRRDGEYDPRAERMGQEAAARQAGTRAEKAARLAFDQEIADLDQEPRPSLRPVVEPLPRGLIRVPAPQLEEVFAEYPLGNFLRHGYLRHWPDPWQLYRCSHHREVYEGDWADERRAFEYFLREGDTRFWQRLDRVQQDYFRRVFRADFDYYSRKELAKIADRAWRQGYDDGWDYGAFVGGEFRYRQGYQEAFAATSERAAREAWQEVYFDRFDQVYRDEYREWSRAVLPELRQHRLLEEEEDGLYEPGEALLLELELWNAGGAAGSVEVLVDGNDLEGGGRQTVRLARRSSNQTEVELRIDPRTPPGTTSRIDVRLDGRNIEIPLRVQRPLELAKGLEIAEIDALAGRVLLRGEVVNRSRRGQFRAHLELAGGGQSTVGEDWLIDTEGRRTVELALRSLAPIDLLAGGLELEARLVARPVRGGREASGVQEGRVQEGRDDDALRSSANDNPRDRGEGERRERGWDLHDQKRVRLPNLAQDLRDHQLLEFWVALQEGNGGRPGQVGDREDGRRVIGLLADRLARDWEIQRQTGGNPYKDDLAGGPPRTELGEWVQASRRMRHLAYPDLQRQLAQETQRLADRLPGTHPFLRRSFEKLAAELDR